MSRELSYIRDYITTTTYVKNYKSIKIEWLQEGLGQGV